jgi:hypothetical protein
LHPGIDEQDNLIIHARLETKEHAVGSDSNADTKISNHIISPIESNSLPPPPPTTSSQGKTHQNILKLTKSKSTPPPSKQSMKRNILFPTRNTKLVSKKALKLAKLYAAQKLEGGNE